MDTALTLIFSRKLVGLCVTVVDFGLFSGNGGGGCKSRSFVSKLVTRSLQGCCPFLFSTSFPMTEICFIPVPKDPKKKKVYPSENFSWYKQSPRQQKNLCRHKPCDFSVHFFWTKKYFLGQMRARKLTSEIYWPLAWN